MNYLFYTGTNIISLVRFLIERVIKQLCETDTVVRTTTARPWRRDKEKKLNTGRKGKYLDSLTRPGRVHGCELSQSRVTGERQSCNWAETMMS